MNEQQFVRELFQTCPNLQTLVFHLNPDGGGVISHLNGVDFNFLTRRNRDESLEEKICLVEMKFSVDELLKLTTFIDNYGGIFLTNIFERRYFFRDCAKALRVKELVEVPSSPFPWTDVHAQMKEMFQSNPLLDRILINQYDGVIRAASSETCLERVIADGKIVDDRFPEYIQNPQSLWAVFSLSKNKIDHGNFRRTEYL